MYAIKNHLLQAAELAATGATIHGFRGLKGRYKETIRNYNFWINEDDDTESGGLMCKIEKYEIELRQFVAK